MIKSLEEIKYYKTLPIQVSIYEKLSLSVIFTYLRDGDLSALMFAV